jgi:hypothetical protein
MNKSIVFGLFSLIVLSSCNFNKEEKSDNKAEEINQPQTYAEISVKEGGEWEGTKYKGGTFTNVSSLEVPKTHTDHSEYIRYEGPGWENPQVGYRLYLDWRNGIDIFGKKVDTLVLAHIGFPHSGSYHEDADWGLDILKAGKSMGLGGFGRFLGDSVAHFRNLENTYVEVNNSEYSSEVKIDYTGWTTGDNTIDLTSVFSIYPEDRHTKVELKPSEEISGLTTGIVKFDDIPVMEKTSDSGEWGYIATYGKQTVAGEDDLLGMAVFYKTSETEKTLEGPHDHLVIFQPKKNITYYFLAAWDKEKKGITSQDEFVKNLEAKLLKLDQKGQL